VARGGCRSAGMQVVGLQVMVGLQVVLGLQVVGLQPRGGGDLCDIAVCTIPMATLAVCATPWRAHAARALTLLTGTHWHRRTRGGGHGHGHGHAHGHGHVHGTALSLPCGVQLEAQAVLPARQA